MMRRILLAIVSAFVVGLMMVPCDVSSGKSTIVTIPDSLGDVGKYNVFFTAATHSAGVSLVNNTWGDNAPVIQAAYFDIRSLSFGLLSNGTYMFGEKLAANLPGPGSALPPGAKYAVWLLWIDRAPWTPTSSLPPYCEAWLQYDGSSYSTVLWNLDTGTISSLPFTINGAMFSIYLSPASIGYLESFWWSGGTFVAKEPFYAAPPWMTDTNDIGVAPGQVWFDIPWPAPA